MHRLFTKYRVPTVLLSFVILFLAVPHITHAAGFLDGFVNVGDFFGRVVTLSIEVFILPLAAGLMYLAGSLMDAAINFSLNTAYIFSLSPAINLGWVIIRDLMNILFIFILIWISLNTIVSGTKFGTMSMLKNVVIAALLINFSLFFTKSIIDVSNVFGNWLYGGVQNTLVANSSDKANPTSLSGLIATRMDIVGMWTLSGTQESANTSSAASPTDPAKSLIGRFLRLAIVLITTYIFIYAAALFLARSITLLFLLVFSPIGFLGEVLDPLKDYSKKWWKELSNAGIFPIAFLLMLYISLQFINSLGVLDLAKTAKPIVIFGANFKVAEYFQYFIIIFLLSACLKVAKEYSGEVGKAIGGAAESLGKMATGVALGAATGGTAFVGRRFIGAAASKLSENGAINDMAAGKRGNNFATKFASQVVGKAALGATRGAAKASFDVRGVSAFNSMAKSLDMDPGKAGGKDGYKGMVKERDEMEKKYAESFGDDKAGIERRLAYAEDRKRSVLTWLAVGDKGRSKIGGTIRNEAGLASVKSDTTDTQKALTEAKNKIVEENMAREMLTQATKSGTTNEVNTILNREVERIEQLRENSQKDKKNTIPYNRYNYLKAEEDGNIDEMSRLDKEFNEATKNMLDVDKRKFLNIEKNEQVQEIKALEEFAENYGSEIKKALEDNDLKTKKLKIDAIKDIIKDRIGEASSEWKPNEEIFDETGKIIGTGKFGKQGKGLAETLRKKQVEIKEKRREQAIMEGKDPGKKGKDSPGVVKKSEPKDAADEDDE